MNTPRPPRRVTALAAIAAAALVLTACGGGAGTSGNGSAGSHDEFTTFTPAGSGSVDKITWNVFQGEPSTIDPFQSADYTPNMINSNMCETLNVQTPEFEIKPNLAEAVSNPDPTTWVYDLRKDVTFWDGTPMTADDVAFSLNHNMTSKTSLYGYLFGNVKSIAKTGEHQVTVKLKSPDYIFNEELASYAGVIVQKKFYTEHGDNVGAPDVGVMCTGPYKFDAWKQGRSINVSKYDGYWNKELPLEVGAIDFTFVTDGSAITAGLLSGQIDGSYDPPVAGVAQLKVSPAGKLYRGPAPLVATVVVANPKGALGNEDVRKALQMAVDWNGLAKQTYGGQGKPASLQTADAAFGFAEDELRTLAYANETDGKPQIEEAKKLLGAVPADVKAKQISLVVPQAAETQQLGLAVKSAAEKIGLKFKLKVVPTTGYSNYLYDPATRGDTDLLYTQFWPNIPNPLDWLGLTAVTGGVFNQSGYSGIDALFAKAVGTKDDAERAKIVVEMEQKILDEVNPMFRGVELHNSVWLGKRISGAPASFSYVYYPWAAHLTGPAE